MHQIQEGSKVTIKTDPNNKYPQAEPAQILESLGIVAHWLSSETGATFKERIELNYEFLGEWNNKAKITEDGTRKYPGDPQSHPCAKFTNMDTGEICFMYPGAWLAVKTDNDWFTTRID